MFQSLKIILIIFILNTSISEIASQQEPEYTSKNTDNVNTSTRNSFPINEIKDFVNVYSKIKAEYLSPIDDAKMINNAIKGMVDNLDEHSTFLEKELFEKFDKKLKGDRVGVGIEVARKDNNILIMTSIYNGSAYKAGIRSGDKIIQINNMTVTNQSLAKVNDELSGLPNTFVILYIENANKKVKMHRLKRTLIKVPSVFLDTLENQFIHIRVSQFQKKTPSEVIKKLQKQRNKNIQGLIIDLRDNPGGLLEAAIKTTDLFISKGEIVSIENRAGKITEKHIAKPPVIIGLDTPIVVIINEGTASAAEIMAGALKDNKRALLIGRDSFGKGSIQTIFSLPNNTAAKLTTSVYILPSGKKLKTSGIKPDIFVSPRPWTLNRYSTDNKTNNEKKDKGNAQDYTLSRAIEALEIISKIN